MPKTVLNSNSSACLNLVEKRGVPGSIFDHVKGNSTDGVKSMFRFRLNEALIRIGVRKMVTATYILD